MLEQALADQIREVASELAEKVSYGCPAEVELADGYVYRVTVEIDHNSSIMDDCGDGYWCGNLAFATTGRWDDNTRRPDGFDGNAEILRFHHSDPIWWQPPADVARGTDTFRELRWAIGELLEFGYIGIVVERGEHRDLYGRLCVTDVRSLWGIESMYEEQYAAEVIGEMLSEMLADAEEN